MSLIIEVSNKVKFKVKGTLNDESGVAKPFDFSLTCIRLDADEIQTSLDSAGKIHEFMAEVMLDWDGLRDANKALVPFSEDAVKALFKIPGMARVVFNTYLAEVGAKEKN